MEFNKSENRIWLTNQNGTMVAEVTFPYYKEGIVDINHTFVDDSLRGQGIAAKIMEETVKTIQQRKLKVHLTCSYASAWFKRHQDYADLIAH